VSKYNNDREIKKLLRHVEATKKDFAKEFKSRWDRRTPVDTGTLQRGNTVALEEKRFVFANSVHYFPYIEDGTETHRPVGMLKTTVVESQAIWDEAWRKNEK
jgi:hypothetical protein